MRLSEKEQKPHDAALSVGPFASAGESPEVSGLSLRPSTHTHQPQEASTIVKLNADSIERRIKLELEPDPNSQHFCKQELLKETFTT